MDWRYIPATLILICGGWICWELYRLQRDRQEAEERAFREHIARLEAEHEAYIALWKSQRGNIKPRP